MTFWDTLRLLEALDVGTQSLVWRITRNSIAVPPWDADRMVEETLHRFESSDCRNTGMLRFSDVYRLLEAIGIDLYRFLQTLTLKEFEGELDAGLGDVETGRVTPGVTWDIEPDAAACPSAVSQVVIVVLRLVYGTVLASCPWLCLRAESEGRTWEAVCRAVGAPQSGMSSFSAEEAAVCKTSPKLEEALRNLGEPSGATLARWSRHELANDILRHFALQYVPGMREAMTFRDVFQLLGAFEVGTRELLSRVAHGILVAPSSEEDAMAERVLQHFSKGSLETGCLLVFRDVYRLLEAIGIDLRCFLQVLSGGEIDDGVHWQDSGGGQTLDAFRLLRPIGSGFRATVYLVEHRQSGSRAALKWPVCQDERLALEAVQAQAPHCLGLPSLLASGTHRGQHYVVTELLGTDLAAVFDRLRGQPLPRRWRAVRLLGRLLLRRLEALHGCGYVHCDVSPHNVLLGRARTRGPGAAEVAPFLIDLGQARPHPGLSPLRGDRPSMEFSSIHSGEGGVPLPADDLEALGWSMVYGLFGKLPWFGLLEEHYNLSESSKERQAEPLARVVLEAKTELLSEGWGALGPGWEHLAGTPVELDAFLRMCRLMAPPATPDYTTLAGLLGSGGEALEAEEAELCDLQEYQVHISPLL